MHIDDFVKEAVATTIQTELRDPIGQTVSAILAETLGDQSFQDTLEDLVSEQLSQALQPRKRPEKKFKTVPQFVDGFIRPNYPTTQGKQENANWSKQWYRHPEVVARFTTLWCTYERLRAENPNGFLEQFLRVHADYHMKHIMSDTGVFASCSHSDSPSIPLPVTPPEPKTDQPHNPAQAES